MPLRPALSSLLALLAALGLGCHAFSAPTYQGPRSDHFDGERFLNPDPRKPQGSFLRWMRERERGPWADWTEEPPGARPPWRVPHGTLRVTFVNHATVLLQLDGVNVLTDPIWSDRCSPVSWVGPRRHRAPGLRFEDLPPIDAVVLSHNHYDHMDVPTLRRLARAFPRVRVFAGLGNATFLRSKGLHNVTEVDWWQELPLSAAVTLVSVPAQHFSSRGLRDRDGTLWTGYAFRSSAGLSYFAGDTGYSPHFRQIRERLGPVRLAVLPIGAYRPEWFMDPVHVSPHQAVRAAQDLEAELSVPMHYGTFRLADDGQEEPVAELKRALEAMGPAAPRFWVLGFGEGRDLPRPGSSVATP
jgi:L-ascorbate metabolism protein UlaG (beta-lactamase superfamily)